MDTYNVFTISVLFKNKKNIVRLVLNKIFIEYFLLITTLKSN